jgi:hypothetical protein
MAIAAGANPSAGTEPGLQANWHFLCAVRWRLAKIETFSVEDRLSRDELHDRKL